MFEKKVESETNFNIFNAIFYIGALCVCVCVGRDIRDATMEKCFN